MASPARARQGAECSPHTPIRLGNAFNGRPFELALPKAMNFNLGLVGASGSGKTTVLSYLIEQFARRGITVIALDTQGDQAGGTSGIDEAYVERMVFRYGDAQAQINPLQLHSHADAGGPYSAIEDAIEVVRLLKPSLGDMQVADLRWLLSGFLDQCNVDMLDQSTWENERIGSWSAFRDFVREQIGTLRAGVASPFFKDFRKATSIARKTQGGREMKVPSEWQTILDSRRGDVIEQSDLEEIIQHRAVAMFHDALAGYSDMDTERNTRRIAVLESIITNMIDSTLFDDDRLSIKPGRVNIIDLSNVSQRHMMSLIHLLLKRTFSIAQRFTRTLNPPVPWLMLALDESKLAVQTGRDVLAPINRIATEGRKYGMGLLLGVQHLGHLNGEIMSSLGTKILLPIDRDKQAETCRRLMVKAGELEAIKPRSDGLVFLNKDAGVPVHLMQSS